ncbi:MAG TPA: type II toxin-antitoxin system RelE/ParE family toxin [Thermoanaerobaculia bacterium]|nr:type II toxin-antitoxin system RelE/ParE family toxin [Thermoanaerobaculia bacterium]
MAVDVEVSESARATIEDLAKTDRRAAEKLAEALLPLRKSPHPRGSRLLGEPPPEDRIWKVAGWEILYTVEADGARVAIGLIRHR